MAHLPLPLPRSSINQTLAVVPPAALDPSAADIGPVVVDGQCLSIPTRVYFPEPPDPHSLGLSEMQQVLLSCLCTRHHSAFVRQRHVGLLLSSTEAWVAPFILALVGEYVIEIVRMIDRKAPTVVTEHCVRFAGGSPEFCTLTSQRVVGYWNCYYRAVVPQLIDDPACACLLKRGL